MSEGEENPVTGCIEGFCVSGMEAAFHVSCARDLLVGFIRIATLTYDVKESRRVSRYSILIHAEQEAAGSLSMLQSLTYGSKRKSRFVPLVCHTN